MLDAPTPTNLRNQVLRKVSQADWDLIGPHLEAVSLDARKIIDAAAKPINFVYFPETGVVSVVAVSSDDHRIEVGVIGYEGFTGTPLVLGDTLAQHSTYMQIGGKGHRVPAEIFATAMQLSENFRALALKSAQGFMTQTSYTALANGRANLEQRLARWLLMAHDRVTTDEIPLTHEFLAVMLGVRRAGVTIAVRSFEKRGLVTTKRGRLALADRPAMEQVAGSFYGAPEAELNRLLGEEIFDSAPVQDASSPEMRDRSHQSTSQLG